MAGTSTAKECEASSVDWGGLSTVRALDIFLQQSTLEWLCGLHGMERQHCMACGGVSAAQFAEKAANASTSVAARNCRAKRIAASVKPGGVGVNAFQRWSRDRRRRRLGRSA